MGDHLLLLLVFSFVLLPSSLAADDTIDRTVSLRDGEKLVSADGTFELGFFSPGGSRRRYVGISFRNIRVDNVVWVANRGAPLPDSSGGVLKVGEIGNLIIADNTTGVVLWSSSSPAAGPARRNNPVAARLLNSGNLVIIDGDAQNSTNTSPYLWQSFDEPGNVLLAGMKLGMNRRTGRSWNLTSWSSADDPSPGSYTLRMEDNKLPRAALLQGSTMIHSSGLWNGVQFSGTPDLKSSDVFFCDVVSTPEELYYHFSPMGKGKSTFSLVVLRTDGLVQHVVWNNRTATWNAFLSGGKDECDGFAACGPNSVCNISASPVCQCPKGFRLASPQDWSLRDNSRGCVLEEQLRCGEGGGDGFLALQQTKLPDTKNATVDMSIGLDQCRDRCLRSCSCTAFARADVREGRPEGCITWSGAVVDMTTVRSGLLQDLYLRVPASVLANEAATGQSRDTKKTPAAVVISVSVASGIAILALCSWGIWMQRRKRNMRNRTTASRGEDADLPLFDFQSIASATKKFSLSNKIGEGGFGVVYKGTLNDGQEVAVKRLSFISVQGVSEFMNEARLIAKLQHKNLVKLLGCCIREEEKMLIYEYMQNKSLDVFIFDRVKSAQLDWSTRLDIVLGIARGLMYLHHDSRLRIIHRDLKTSNILLDGDMNPKISDFGTARIFGADQNAERTKRVIGTYGYMSPEYALNGVFSVKSDVYSFGVLTLELLSGERNRGFYEGEPLTLLSRAWTLWQEGRSVEFLDKRTSSVLDETKISRCLQIALLCVQDQPSDRPTMSTVVMMLATESFPLPNPKGPGVLHLGSSNSSGVHSSSKEDFTENEITITNIEGR